MPGGTVMSGGRATRVDGVKAELLDREVSRQGERRVQADRRVTLREHEPVPLGPVRLARPDPHLVEVERGQDLGCREGTPDVATLGVRDRPEQLDPDPARHLLEQPMIHGDLAGRTAIPGLHLAAVDLSH
jgi:hypothetical protein